MAIILGQKAPDFTLFDSDKNKISLSNFAGKNVVLLFFPQAFTSVCTKELCEVRDNMIMYNGINTQVLAISVDSLFTLAKFKELQQLNFPLLSDFNKEVSTAYGCIYETFVFDMKGVSKRSAFVIDATRTIKYAEILENAPDTPNFNAITETLAALEDTKTSKI
jgi:peroxiredoxin